MRSEIQKTKKSRADLIILDLNLPDIDGIKACEIVRKQIWRDSQLYHSSRVVDVHVQRLRKKIEPNIERPEYIVTVAEVGYKFKSGLGA